MANSVFVDIHIPGVVLRSVTNIAVVPLFFDREPFHVCFFVRLFLILTKNRLFTKIYFKNVIIGKKERSVLTKIEKKNLMF